MEIPEIKALMAQFDTSSLTEFELNLGEASVYMSKNVHNRSLQEVAKSPEHPLVSQLPVTVAQASNPSVETPVAPVLAVAETAGETITSPLVGVVYLKPAPAEACFKKVGDTVKKGETVCIVEAMKLMNEIASTVDGTIAEILVENEAVVEFGQALFRVSV